MRMTKEQIRVFLVDDEDDYIINRDLFAEVPAIPYRLNWAESEGDGKGSVFSFVVPAWGGENCLFS
jgi:hypothetical protein